MQSIQKAFMAFKAKNSGEEAPAAQAAPTPRRDSAPAQAPAAPATAATSSSLEEVIQTYQALVCVFLGFKQPFLMVCAHLASCVRACGRRRHAKLRDSRQGICIQF